MVGALVGCTSTAPPPSTDASTDASADGAFDCASKLHELDDLRLNASVCTPGDACNATIADFCCPIYVVSAASDGAQAFRMAYDRYRAAGCPGTLCSAKPCTTTPACAAGRCVQP